MVGRASTPRATSVIPSLAPSNGTRPIAATRGRGPSRFLALDALRRLTADGDRRFDRSKDVHPIGVGVFDARRATRSGNVEAGNVPVTIRGISVRNVLSFHYDSGYFLDGGALACEDMRAGCSRHLPHGPGSRP